MPKRAKKEKRPIAKIDFKPYGLEIKASRTKQKESRNKAADGLDLPGGEIHRRPKPARSAARLAAQAGRLAVGRATELLHRRAVLQGQRLSDRARGAVAD